MNLQGYLDYINAPWGRLFYRLVWKGLPFEGKTILDFGSGFGVTASHLAEHNTVYAVEPNEEMLDHRVTEHPYTQLTGGIETLTQFPDGMFDVILCHNVLEYVEKREELLQEFSRLLKSGGTLSVVKHNPAGKILQKAVFENNTESALSLLRGEQAVSENFGEVREYTEEELAAWCGKDFLIKKQCGIRIFYGLQRNDFKYEPDWEDRLYALECAVAEMSPYADIAFFRHVILKKR